MSLPKSFRIKLYTTKTPEEIAEYISKTNIKNSLYFKRNIKNIVKQLPNVTKEDVTIILDAYFTAIKISLFRSKVLNMPKIFNGLRLHATNFLARKRSMKVQIKSKIYKKIERTK